MNSPLKLNLLRISIGAAFLMAAAGYPAKALAVETPLDVAEVQLVGSCAPELLPAGSPCQDCSETCPAILAFASSDSAFYLYNASTNSIAHFVFRNAVATCVSVEPGVTVSAQNELPHDGCVTPDGSVYLIADKGTLSQRYIVYSRSPHSTAWVVVSVFDHDSIGYRHINGRRTAVQGAVRISSDDRGKLIIYDISPGGAQYSTLDLSAGNADAAQLSRTGLAQITQRVGNLRDLKLWSTRLTGKAATPDRRSPQIQGRLVAYDAAERPLSMELHDGGVVLALYSSEGAKLCDKPLPKAKASARLLGKGEFVQLARDRILQFIVTKEGLRVFQWKVS